MPDEDNRTVRVALQSWEPTDAEMSAAPPMPEFIRWGVAQMLLHNRKLIESNGQAAIEAVATALQHGILVPPWLVTAFCKPLERFHRYEVRTLDEAFGIPPQAAKRIQTLRDRRSLQPVVCTALLDAIRSKPERPIDKGLFDEIGEKLGIGATHCEELYRSAVRRGDAQNLKEFKKVIALSRGAAGKLGKRSRLVGLLKQR